MQSNRNEGTIKICQKNYIQTITKKFNLENSYSNTPMSSSLQLKKPAQKENEINQDIPYRELVGCLMYVSVQTRPDIPYSVSKLDGTHGNAAKQIAKYLSSRKDYAITFGKEVNNEIKGYCYVYWAGDIESRKSPSGILFTIGGTAFIWKSKLQSIVASSRMEAEYISMSLCTREALWVQIYLTILI